MGTVNRTHSLTVCLSVCLSVQLYELQRFYASLMVVGPAGIGKTRCIQSLLKTISGTSDGGGAVYREARVNPKSLSVDQLFGGFNETTNDWTDGVFSALLRRSTHTTRGRSIVGYLV